MTEHEQVRARQMVVETEHPTAGLTKALGLPVKFSETPGRVRRAAPLYGEHTEEVLRETGFSPEEIERMLASGAARGTERLQRVAAE